MLLYCTPGGTWAGTEKDYKAALKAEGIDHKTAIRRQVDVPTSKAALMEFLTFHHVNPINPDRPAPAVNGARVELPTAGTTILSSLDIADHVEALPITAQIDILVSIADRAHKALCAK